MEIPQWSAMRSDRVQVGELLKKDDLDWTHALTKRNNGSVNDGLEMTGDLAKTEEPPAVTFRKILNDPLGGRRAGLDCQEPQYQVRR